MTATWAILFIACVVIPAICETVTTIAIRKQKIIYIYKILDKSTGEFIEVKKNVFDAIYESLEPIVKERNRKLELYNKQVKENTDEQ